MFQLTQVEKAKRIKQFGDFKYKNVIVEDDDGNTIQSSQKTLIRGNSRHSNKHLFSNLLKCGNCGGSLRRRVINNKLKNNRINTYTYWFCRNSELHGKTKCYFRNVQHEKNLIEFVKNEIINYRNSPRKRKYYLDTILRTKYNTKDIKKKKLKLQEEIEEINIDKHGLIKSVGRELITEHEFLIEKKKLDAQLFKAESKLKQLIYIDNEIKALQANFNRFTKFLEQVDVENLTNSILRKIVHSITVETHGEPIFPGAIHDKHTLNIEWNFLDTTEKEILSESLKKLGKSSGSGKSLELTENIIEELANIASRKPTDDELLWNLEKFHKTL
ncbi:zinc ribbon domain-containing protein [Paenibacillus sp. FSL H8-0332]|uniref:zinc ribbon domain-containing protein n=1 Tax=Paenibacillus sp. FSL H8-0332 TaxID=2954742 RepID=UPI0030CFE273